MSTTQFDHATWFPNSNHITRRAVTALVLAQAVPPRVANIELRNRHLDMAQICANHNFKNGVDLPHVLEILRMIDEARLTVEKCIANEGWEDDVVPPTPTVVGPRREIPGSGRDCADPCGN